MYPFFSPNQVLDAVGNYPRAVCKLATVYEPNEFIYFIKQRLQSVSSRLDHPSTALAKPPHEKRQRVSLLDTLELLCQFNLCKNQTQH